MTIYFCSNSQCINHVDLHKIPVVKKFRHRYGNGQYLCATCHNAVKLYKKLQNQKRIDVIHRQLNGCFAYVKPNLEVTKC